MHRLPPALTVRQTKSAGSAMPSLVPIRSTRVMNPIPAVGREAVPQVGRIETGLHHDFSRVNVDAGAPSWPAGAGLTPMLHTSRQAAESQADEIARHVAAPELAREGTLPAGLMERLGRDVGGDFRRVRVHSDAAAAHRVKRHGADAMSEGRHLYFATGRWRPDTPEGAFLAAHEAVHAAQQGFAERGVTRGEGRYFDKKKPKPAKDPNPKADPRDVFDEITRRAPDLAAFVNVKTINSVMAGKSSVEGPAVSGGTSGADTHEWHVSLTLSQVHAFSETGATPIVTTRKTKRGQVVKHVVAIFWGTFAPFGSGAEYDTQAAEAEKAKMLPPHAARAKDYAFELKVSEPLIHELLHARIIMEKDPTFTGAPRTPLVQGYFDAIAASQSAAVSKPRNALRSQIWLMAGLHDQAPDATTLSSLVDSYDDFLVHEKYDVQKVFALMGRTGANNQEIAKAYSKVVDNGLVNRFGDSSVSDQEARTQLLKLEKATAAYYDAIDAAMAAGSATSPPSSTSGTAPAPPTSVPATTPKK